MRTGNMTFSRKEMSLGWGFSDLWTVLYRVGAVRLRGPPGGAHVRHFENIAFSPRSDGLVLCK